MIWNGYVEFKFEKKKKEKCEERFIKNKNKIIKDIFL